MSRLARCRPANVAQSHTLPVATFAGATFAGRERFSKWIKKTLPNLTFLSLTGAVIYFYTLTGAIINSYPSRASIQSEVCCDRQVVDRHLVGYHQSQNSKNSTKLTLQDQPVDLFLYRQAFKHCIATLYA